MTPTLDPFGEDQDELDAVVIKDNGEPLVDFLGLSPKLIAAVEHPVYDFPRTHIVRKSVANMLAQAADALPDGLFLSVFEGYRPIQVQRAMFNSSLQVVSDQHPHLTPVERELEAGRRSAPPDAITPPPHITGGAVDVEIADANGKILDFWSPYERSDWRQASPNAKGLSEEAMKNRALLKSILEPTGLTNYVDEWWHWSYGDNGWALRVNAPHALYNRVELPEDIDWVGDPTKLPNL